MSKARPAASALAVIHPDDRAWVLSRLDSDQRAYLEAELQRLNRMSAKTILKSFDVPVAVAPSDVAQDAEQLLMSAEVSEITPLLQGLAPGPILCVLQAKTWPWRDAVVMQFRTEERRQMKHASEVLRAQIGGGFMTALLDELAASLREARARQAPASQRFEAYLQKPAASSGHG